MSEVASKREESRGGWLGRFLEEEREVQFSRQEQLTMAGMGHALILVGVTIILATCFKRWPGSLALTLFYVMEGVIVAFGVIATMSTRQVVSAIDKSVLNVPDMSRSEKWMNKHPKLKDRVQAGILALLFALQFGSMAALLIATSGPIESPFAPMALAIGVFTPFIVNRWWTVAVVILGTMAFYLVITLVVGTGGNVSSPQAGAYVAVNLFILLLASVMTFKRRDSLSFSLTKVVEASPERVWRAWTDPREVSSWLANSEDNKPEVSLNVIKGGVWRVTLNGEDGQPGLPWYGRYLAVEPPERLVFTVDARSGIGDEIITVAFKKRGERATEVVVTQTDHGRFDGLKRGWSGFMRRMGSYVMLYRDAGSKGDSASQ
jgi:uncharacterized protein YndB with AHSA1/START domain